MQGGGSRGEEGEGGGHKNTLISPNFKNHRIDTNSTYFVDYNERLPVTISF
jgi:hypothetical protein